MRIRGFVIFVYRLRDVRQRTNPPIATQGKLDEAGPLYKKSLAIQESALGPDHLDVAATRIKWAALLLKQVRGL